MRFQRVLILAQDGSTRGALCAALRRLEVAAEELVTLEQAVAQHDLEQENVLLLLLAHEAEAGAALLDQLVAARPAVTCALVCSHPSGRGVRQALQAGALDVLPLPRRREELSLALERLEHLAELRAAVIAVPEDLAPRLANRRIADIERVAILATLKSTGGNKTEAARRLGITARTVSNKLKIWRSSGLVA